MIASESRLSWGILGTGNIAHTFARGLAKSRTGRLAAVASRQQASAEAFAKEFGSVRACGSYEALLADPSVQAVYISTPHPFHAEWCVRAARAGKHILCEKPLTLNHADAVKVAQAARENGVFLMEAFMYRCHPQTAKLVELIRAGAIGRLAMIRAAFGFKAAFNPEDRLFKNELGGGAILDVGCYTISISRLLAGAAQGLPFADPTRIDGAAYLHPEAKVDLYAAALAEFPGDILAELATSVGLEIESGLWVFGTEGSLCVKSPFIMGREGEETTILLRNGKTGKTEEIRVPSPNYLYALEADAVGEALAAGKLESPCVPVEDTLGNMAALDAWRRAVGLVYAGEK